MSGAIMTRILVDIIAVWLAVNAAWLVLAALKTRPAMFDYLAGGAVLAVVAAWTLLVIGNIVFPP
jgi:hypothetical protein